VFDVAPTILALLGLPPDARMEGSPVGAAFARLEPLPAERLFERTRVTRVAAEPVSSAEAQESVRKLVALGYVSATDAAARPAAAAGPGSGMTEGAWNNLGLYEREVKKNPAEAERDFRKALAIRPGYSSPLFNLAILYRGQRRDALARDFLFQAIRAGHADPEGTILSWAGEYRAARAAAAETALLRDAASALPDSEPIARALGDALFRAHDCSGAEGALARFDGTTKEVETLNGLGLYETCLGRRDRAVDLFRRSLAMKPDQPGVVEALRVLGP
jgi:tetratricopeptide (TPR) repeat protein